MRSTSNPAFRNLPVGGSGYAGFNSAPAGLGGAAPGYADAALATGRPMTIDDVVTKTGITLAVLMATGAATYLTRDIWGLAIPAALIGFVLALVITFKKVVSPPLILVYAAVEGVFLGGISGFIGEAVAQRTGSGTAIVFQAMAGTAMVFVGMLVVYKTGAVRVTPRFTKWLMGAMIGVVGLMLINLIASFFVGGGIGIRDGSPLAIIFSLVCIAIAAFSFLLDFDAAEQAIRGGAPEKTAWYIAFGLTMTLVWLYLEILYLLSYFQGD